MVETISLLSWLPPLYSGGYLPVVIIILPYGRLLLPLRGPLPWCAMIRLILQSKVLYVGI